MKKQEHLDNIAECVEVVANLLCSICGVSCPAWADNEDYMAERAYATGWRWRAATGATCPKCLRKPKGEA